MPSARDIGNTLLNLPAPNWHNSAMETSDDNLWQSLGLLRLALLALALINMLLPIIHLQTGSAAVSYHGLWNLLATVIAPTMAPLFVVVLLFDYLMSRVRAADAEGDTRALYTRIGRIELAVMALTLIFWVPYFIYLLN